MFVLLARRRLDGANAARKVQTVQQLLVQTGRTLARGRTDRFSVRLPDFIDWFVHVINTRHLLLTLAIADAVRARPGILPLTFSARRVHVQLFAVDRIQEHFRSYHFLGALLIDLNQLPNFVLELVEAGRDDL